METILKAIQCSECNNVLESPVFLPCSHSICKKHTTEKKSRENLRCAKCGLDHEIPSNGFPLNEALYQIIDAQIGSIDFGCVHKEATESCGKLNRYIQDLENLLNNPSAYIHDEISQLKNQVNLKSEQLKLKIDEETEKLLVKLNDYQTRCENSINIELYLSKKAIYESRKKISSTCLSVWKSELNELKFDESKWKKIAEICNKSIEEFEKRIKAFKKDLLLDDFTNYSKDVDFFQQVSIDALFIRIGPSNTSNQANNVIPNNLNSFYSSRSFDRVGPPAFTFSASLSPEQNNKFNNQETPKASFFNQKQTLNFNSTPLGEINRFGS